MRGRGTGEGGRPRRWDRGGAQRANNAAPAFSEDPSSPGSDSAPVSEGTGGDEQRRRWEEEGSEEEGGGGLFEAPPLTKNDDRAQAKTTTTLAKDHLPCCDRWMPHEF